MCKPARLAGLVSMVVFLAVGGIAQADLLTGIGGGIAEYTDYLEKTYDEGDDTLAVHVDFAVYAPGVFPEAGDPSPGNEYVYAYQILNLEASTVPVTAFSVGHEPGAVINNDGYIQDIGSGEVEPDIYGVGSSSIQWIWALLGGEEIDPTERSSILLYTSPDGPQWDTATMLNGGVPTPVGKLPSPTPEPATIALMATGLALVGIGRARRRR